MSILFFYRNIIIPIDHLELGKEIEDRLSSLGFGVWGRLVHSMVFIVEAIL